MDRIRVFGEQRVNGSVQISGAKNAALPLLAASILSENGLTLKNVPPLSDIATMLLLLETHLIKMIFIIVVPLILIMMV